MIGNWNEALIDNNCDIEISSKNQNIKIHCDKRYVYEIHWSRINTGWQVVKKEIMD